MCPEVAAMERIPDPVTDETIRLIHRATLTRMGSIYRMTNLSVEDVVHECLALLLAEKRHEPCFWKTLEPCHFGTFEYRLAQRTLLRAVDRAIWRCRNVRKITIRRSEHPGGRQRVLERDVALGESDVLVIDGIASDVSHLDRALDIAAAFDGLGCHGKDVLFARAVFQYAWSDIARSLNIPVSRARTIYHEAMTVLATSLKAYRAIP
jgi:DNA-directed RNA polymerase specialized sigma24 family protein